MDSELFQFSTPAVLLLLTAFYGGTFLMSRVIKHDGADADGFMTANQHIGFGLGAASMTATWVWAASFYAAAESGFTYGVSGPIHYGFWGALMILFIYPFGQRFRELAPNAHTLGELIHARHGASSQLMLAVSNLLGSIISLMVNLTAAGALVSVLSPLSFQVGVVVAGLGVLSYTLHSGFRASVFTDFGQLVAMMLIAVVIIPAVLFAIGGPSVMVDSLSKLTAEQTNIFSKEAFLHQGAPYFVAVLAYAIGNQTISQRLFAVDESHIKPTFITATISYGAIVIGLGMIGLMALSLGVEPMRGEVNNLIPQMVSTYLSPVFIVLFFILVIGSLSSTADSDLSALSAIMMADVYGKNIAGDHPDPRKMLIIGRMTMITATVIGMVLASFSMNILVMLVFVGALWGAIVFPVIASCFWNRVTNAAFTWSVLIALVVFTSVRFGWLPLTGVTALALELTASVGAGVVAGLMAFGFLGKRVGMVCFVIATLVIGWLGIGHLRDYHVLLSSLTAYGVSTLVCIGISLASNKRFDFSSIQQRVGSYNQPTNKTH